MRLLYGYIGPNWAYDTTVKYDMQRLRAYDSVYTVRRRLDCMEFGFSFHTRNQGFSQRKYLVRALGANNSNDAGVKQLFDDLLFCAHVRTIEKFHATGERKLIGPP